MMSWVLGIEVGPKWLRYNLYEINLKAKKKFPKVFFEKKKIYKCELFLYFTNQPNNFFKSDILPPPTKF